MTALRRALRDDAATTTRIRKSAAAFSHNVDAVVDKATTTTVRQLDKDACAAGAVCKVTFILNGVSMRYDAKHAIA